MNPTSRLRCWAAAWALLAGGQLPAQEKTVEQPDPAKAKEFEAACRLEKDQVFKHLPLGSVPGRTDYYVRENSPNQGNILLPSCMYLIWRGENQPLFGTNLFDTVRKSFPIKSHLQHLLKLPGYAIEGDDAILQYLLEGDFVTRPEASGESLIAALQVFLRQQINPALQLKIQKVERTVLVAHGRFRFAPLEPDDPFIHVYTTWQPREVQPKSKSDSVNQGKGKLEALIPLLADRIQTQILMEIAELPPHPLKWKLHMDYKPPRFAGDDAQNDSTLLLQNFTAQTGIEFKEEKRQVHRLIVDVPKENAAAPAKP